MAKKWYNFFVSTDRPGSASQPAGPGKEKGATDQPRAVADIVAGLGEPPSFAAPVANPDSFGEIYAAAEIRPPAHGYTILKIGEMLQSQHIQNLPAGVKKSTILVALEASGANIQDVIEDAVRRDRALDVYEKVQQRSLAELEKKKTEENQAIQGEMDRIVAEHRARIQANNDELARAREQFRDWRLKKQQEEQRISESVSYFVTENPITTAPGPAEPPQPPEK